jgi:AraC-like DNA-binding protein
MNTIWNEFSQGWLGIGFLYVRLRIVLTIMYWLLQFFMIRRLFILAKDNNLLVENRDLVKWLKIFMASQAVFFVPYFDNIFAGTKKEFFFVTHILLMVSVAISLLSLFMLPKVLYGLKGLVLSTDKDEHTLTQNEIKSADKRHSYLAKDKLEMLSSLITKHFLQTKPYLKKGYTVGTLAAEIDLQPYVVSAVVNQAFQVNANDFINRYRITYAKQLIHKGEAELQTLEAMAEKCGFNNRNSFTTAFKKHTGKTPSGFISEYKKQKARQEKAPFE